MNGDGSKQRYVSTFRMHIKPPGALSAAGNEPGTIDIRTSDKWTDIGSLDPPSCNSLDPPAFIEPLEDCSVDEGSDITLRGVLTGSQPIKVSWLHNGEVARFGKPSFDGREMSFVVRECLPEDAGAYTCLAENSAGKTSCCAAVFVKDFETIYGVQNRVSKSPTSAFKSPMENGRTPQSPKDELQKFRGSICSSPTGSDKLSPVSSPKEVIPKKRANSGTGPALHFKNPPQHIEVKAGETSRVTCVFTGSPPVVSCWIRNKEQVS